MATKKQVAADDKARAIVTNMMLLGDSVARLTDVEERALGARLVAVWDALMRGVENEYTTEATIALAGLARRLAEEYGLPGDFK